MNFEVNNSLEDEHCNKVLKMANWLGFFPLYSRRRCFSVHRYSGYLLSLTVCVKYWLTHWLHVFFHPKCDANLKWLPLRSDGEYIKYNKTV